MSDEVDTPTDTATDQPDRKAVVGGAFSAAAETYDQVVGFFAPFGRALLTAAAPDRSAKVLLAAKMVAQLNAEFTTVPWSRTRLEAPRVRRPWTWT